MAHVIEVERREAQGKGASRRLRRDGKVPAIVYGGDRAPANIQLDHEKLWLAQQNEWFYSSILDLSLNGQIYKVLLRDLQRHPYKQQILHLDFQRVSENEVLRAAVPLHFVNEAKSPAGTTAGVGIMHELTEVTVACLPKDLPESIEVDLSDLAVGAVVHLSELKLPAGVELPQLKLGPDHDVAVVVAKAAQGGAEAAAAEGEEEAKEAHCVPPGPPGGTSAVPVMAEIRLIVGLGNPGPEHAHDRHNAGFRLVDTLAERQGARFGLDSKLFGETARVQIGGRDVWLLKPATFMNLSGKSVAAALRFWKIEPEQVLLVHDELDLPPGTARLKFDGGHGGQNGLRDTIRLLGHGRFHRLRIGIGHPGHKDRVVGWVLGRPGKDDDILIGRAIDDAIDVLPLVVNGDVNEAMK